MGKRYLEQSVYEAARERLAYIFSEFDNIYVSFSGGKDSGVLLNLVRQFMAENNVTKRVGLFHQDYEAQYTATTDYVTRTFEACSDMERYWFCLPVATRSATSNSAMFWYPWDDERPDLWVRPMPEAEYVYSLDNNPVSRYEHKMLAYQFPKRFGLWHRDAHGGGKTIALLGLRTDESLQRYSGIVNKREPYNGHNWITREASNVWSASPIYDWDVTDLWIANGKYGWDYNRLYDVYEKAGVPLNSMRVASPFLDDGKGTLNLYRVIEPAMWAKLVGRVAGANFAAIYGGTKALGFREVTLPTGHTWKSYTKFLLSTLPKDVRDNYVRRFQVSIRFWYKTGGGFTDDIIREIEEAGYQIERNGVSNFTKHKDSRITFRGIPDNTDNISGTMDIPSWKRMAFCILKNDHMCKFMGFGLTKQQMQVKRAVVQYYKDSL